MDDSSIPSLILLFVLLIISAFFSAVETAYSGLNRIRLKNLAASGNKNAQRVLDLCAEYDKVLSTTLIGNNIVNITIASIATVMFVGYFGDAGITVSTFVTTVAVLILGEITPKSLAKEAPEFFAMLSLPIMRVLVFIAAPVNTIFVYWKKILKKLFRLDGNSSITEEELITIIDEVEDYGLLDEHKSDLIRSAIELDDVCAEDILTPRVNLFGVSENASVEEIKAAFLETQLSRLLVYRKSIDNIIGIIMLKDFYALQESGNSDVSKCISEVKYVSEKMKIPPLLKMFQGSRVHIAVVVDEFGGTAGIVTLEDVIEELIGEIWDEHDEVIEQFQKTEDGKYRISCEASLDKCFKFLQLDSDTYDRNTVTVSGFVIETLGRIPEVGDSFVFEELRITVVRTDGKRVLEIEVEDLR